MTEDPEDRQLPDDWARFRLPSIPAGVTWYELNLSLPTLKVLAAAFPTPQDLNGITVEELSQIPALSRLQVYRLLFAIRECWAAQSSEGNSHPPRKPRKQWLLAQQCLPAPPPGVTFDDLAIRRNDWLLARIRSAGLASQPSDLGRIRRARARVLSGGRRAAVAQLVRRIEELNALYRARTSAKPDALAAARVLYGIPQAELVRADDLRFGSYVRSLAANANNAREAAAHVLAAPERAWLVVDQIQELREGIGAALSMSLERELAGFIGTGRDRQARATVLRCLGWDGGGVRRMSQVAREFGCSRQAIFERLKSTNKLLKGARPFAPTLDRALAAIEGFAPGPAGPAERHLLSAGLTERQFALSGVLKAATLLGRTTPLVLKHSGEDVFLLTPEVEKESATTAKLADQVAGVDV